MGRVILSSYHFSFLKRFFDITLSFMGLMLAIPILLIVILAILVISGPPVFFIQKRTGLNGKPFKIIKFRTMVKNADKVRYKYKRLNEADGPVFKIQDDPRFTKVGRVLSRLGIDELPQLFNILKGDMSLVGPRPLPVYESRELTKIQKERELIKPGATSLWVINGSHRLSFEEWMAFDKYYMQNASLYLDIKIIFRTLLIHSR